MPRRVVWPRNGSTPGAGAKSRRCCSRLSRHTAGALRSISRGSGRHCRALQATARRTRRDPPRWELSQPSGTDLRGQRCLPPSLLRFPSPHGIVFAASRPVTYPGGSRQGCWLACLLTSSTAPRPYQYALGACAGTDALAAILRAAVELGSSSRCLDSLLFADAAEGLPRQVAARVQLAFRHGGLGFRSAVHHAPAVFWVSWADTFPELDAPSAALTPRLGRTLPVCSLMFTARPVRGPPRLNSLWNPRCSLCWFCMFLRRLRAPLPLTTAGCRRRKPHDVFGVQNAVNLNSGWSY